MMDFGTLNTRPKVVLFVGSNPSNSSETDVAFHGSTKSSQLLTQWCKNLTMMKMHINVLDKKTEGNRPLKSSEISANLPDLQSKLDMIKPDRVVALGKTAARALTLLHIPHYEMPHPSGCNRKLNDPKYVKEKVKGLEHFCSNPS
jgi:uracil-DNA glycosylase family 4